MIGEGRCQALSTIHCECSRSAFLLKAEHLGCGMVGAGAVIPCLLAVSVIHVDVDNHVALNMLAYAPMQSPMYKMYKCARYCTIYCICIVELRTPAMPFGLEASVAVLGR